MVVVYRLSFFGRNISHLKRETEFKKASGGQTTINDKPRPTGHPGGHKLKTSGVAKFKENAIPPRISGIGKIGSFSSSKPVS